MGGQRDADAVHRGRRTEQGGRGPGGRDGRDAPRSAKAAAASAARQGSGSIEHPRQLTQATPLVVAFEPWTGLTAGSTGLTPDVIAYHQPGHQVSKQYAELWTTMIAGLPAAATCCCSPACAARRATTVLVNLAVTSALQTKRRTAIIDPADAAARPGRTLGDQTRDGAARRDRRAGCPGTDRGQDAGTVAARLADGAARSDVTLTTEAALAAWAGCASASK